MITSDQVTVIIPCFNSQSYISRAVESVLNQSCMPGKILLVDDNSRDKTLELLLQIQKSNPHANIEVAKNLEEHLLKTGSGNVPIDYLFAEDDEEEEE